MENTTRKIYCVETLLNIDDEEATMTIYDDSAAKQYVEDYETKVELPDGTLYAFNTATEAERFLDKRGFRF